MGYQGAQGMRLSGGVDCGEQNVDSVISAQNTENDAKDCCTAD